MTAVLGFLGGTVIKPAQVMISPLGFLTGMLGKVELEAAAALVVWYHQWKGLGDWTPVSRKQVAELLEGVQSQIWQNPLWRPDPYKVQIQRWAHPFWRPDFYTLSQQGWLDGWVLENGEASDPAIVGMLTPKFFEALERAQAHLRGVSVEDLPDRLKREDERRQALEEAQG